MNRNIVTTVLLSIFISISGFAQDKKWGLEECVNYALENNISIKQTALDTDLADQDLISAKGNFLPNVNASASQDWNFGSFIGQDGNRVSIDSRGNSFGLNTGVTLFNGFRNTSIYKQAQLGIESSELQLSILKDNISVNVVNQYLNILLNKENLKVAEEQVAITEKQVIQVSELVDSGVRPRADLFEVEAQLASDRERLTNVENSLELAKLALTQLLQISNEGFDVEEIELSLPEVLVEHKSSNEIYDYALQNRPEIKKAELDIENSILAIDIAKSAYYPTLSFGAGLGTSYQHFQGQEDLRVVIDPNDPTNISLVENGFWQQLEDNLGYNLGFRLDIPIFNRMQTKVSVDKAKINKERIAYSLDQAKQDLRSTIEQAYTDAKAAFKQFEASQVSLNAQKEAFKNAQESYNSGVMNSFEFEQVRNRLVNAEANLINAKYNFVFTTKVLDFYLGKPLTD
ncbi:MAG: transporter [Xanthomarina sp.]|uniref:TolC family protein n=1 Tax=Xanthomarina sp. TaxID=1931211 RepID=UPI000C39196C|nr:TolC family protein [Xanthomarina sp.]MBF61274.1 transporter [Xanthomarina sp.]|tara:strand:+ start:452 stop:1828 length:1377 start_codon:yes stop_codon:yes gene_type:complete